MTVEREITGCGDGYRGLADQSRPPEQVKQEVFRLSHRLAAATRELLHGCAPTGDVLCAVVLRGGLLLYPGFGQAFAATDFCLLGTSCPGGDRGRLGCDYLTAPSRPAYTTAILIDCVVASDNTLLAAQRLLATSHQVTNHLAAVLCSSHRGTRRLLAAGIHILGFSLHERMEGDTVLPDLGAMDAGDLVSGHSAGSPAR